VGDYSVAGKIRIVVLPDSHSKPFFRKVQNEEGHWNSELIPKLIANRRYDWLASFIIDQIKTLEPGEVLFVVDLGDFIDLKSLASYDKGKAEAELERLELDIDYGLDARERMMKPVLDYLAELKRQKRGKVVHFVCNLGNHENRWARFRSDNPAWVNFDGIPDDITQASKFGATIVPFLVPYDIAGISFCHYYYKKDPRFAISGVTPARSLVLYLKKSAVCGHTHDWDVHTATSVLGTVKCVYCGCYYEHTDKYPGPQGHASIWRGLTVFTNCHNGSFNEVKYPLEEIKRKYIKEIHGDPSWVNVVADIPYKSLKDSSKEIA
jgi:hypothetical protein